MMTIYGKNTKSDGTDAMNVNRISVELSSTDIDAINWAIAILAAKLQPLLIALEDEDKENLPKLCENSILFVETSLLYAESDIEFLPEFIDVAQMKQTVATFNLLSEFLRPLRQIIRNLDDTA